MNKYLITALYVIAGCAVAVPLKAQNSGELLKGDRYRLLITNTTKAISVYIEVDVSLDSCGLPLDYCSWLKVNTFKIDNSYDNIAPVYRGTLCRTSYKIRAPETL